MKSWGMKTAFSPAESAGLMSERGLLPIIQVQAGSQEWWAATLGRPPVCFCVATSTEAKWPKEAGAHESAGLLDWIALRDEDQAVAGGEIGQGVRDAGEKFNLMVSNGLGEAEDAGVLFGGDRGLGELLEAVDQRAAEAPQSVTMGGNGGMLARG